MVNTVILVVIVFGSVRNHDTKRLNLAKADMIKSWRNTQEDPGHRRFGRVFCMSCRTPQFRFETESLKMCVDVALIFCRNLSKALKNLRTQKWTF